MYNCYVEVVLHFVAKACAFSVLIYIPTYSFIFKNVFYYSDIFNYDYVINNYYYYDQGVHPITQIH